MAALEKILEKYRKISTSEVDKGTKFERLMKNFLPLYYRGEIENVMLWSEFSNEKDLGIDLVAKTYGGDFWAIQCKFYAENTIIEKSAVDSFFSNSSRTFDGKQFSLRIFISTSDNFTDNADKMFKNQTPPAVKIGMEDLRQADFDWEKIDAGIFENARKSRNLREYQQDALKAAHEHFLANDRGKLIMACGTGKTFTSLRIAENLTDNQGLVLFLVPSLSLVKQTLNEWRNYSIKAIRAICVCSDKTVASNDDIQDVPLQIPVTNQPEEIATAINRKGNFGMTVIFSTYQSIEKVIDANLNFDLVICDEAHRTAGNSQKDKESKLFSLVHDNEKIKSKLRLYMTATPKLYSENLKSAANAKNLTVWSMDDEKIFGKEIYRISFKKAIELDCLSDYKLLIFAVSENEVQQAMRAEIFEEVERFIEKEYGKSSKEIKLSFDVDDIAKLIGTINAMSKRVTEDSKDLLEGDLQPMNKAVAFLPKIAKSKVTAHIFEMIENIYRAGLADSERQKLITINATHVDGSFNSGEREEILDNLKNTPNNLCNIISNVRCLSEGVDVPSLDAVIFLTPKKSKIDIIQAVGRALRKADGKNFGYVIVPIIVPSVVNGEIKKYFEENNEKYATIYEVARMLGAHDETMNVELERLQSSGKSKKINIICTPEFDAQQTNLPFEIFQTELIAQVVNHAGNKNYWYEWAGKVSVIVQRHTENIWKLIKNENSPQHFAFQHFLKDLQKIINPAITDKDAVEMLAQHLVTRPIFEALFENYSFAANNPVSKSMTEIISQLDKDALNYERAELKEFYDNVKESCRDMGDAANRQKIIVSLYDSFFRMALPLTVQKLGIVYTPVEVVDFILQSVNDVLQKEFNRTISDENVHVLDPFTGTGTFITRLIQSGLIDKIDLPRKYQYELHANEIVLLAYYIAAINIENSFHAAANSDEYQNFNGICLTDTFQSYENQQAKIESESYKRTLNKDEFATPLKENAEMINRQLDTKIEIIIGNPPYSVGQKSANDNAQNNSYPKLEKRIAETYAAGTSATNKNSLYDSYIKAFRWASDRIADTGGIVAFVTNAGWLDGAAMDGLRNCFAKEFSSIYVFNLRGNARTQGEIRRKEAGNIFDSGSRAPIAITILVKNPSVLRDAAEIFYYEVDDYLSREEKLAKIENLHSVLSDEFKILVPNEKGDWINQRGNDFENFLPLAPEKKFDAKSESFFITYSRGIATARDVWIYNFSKSELTKNMQTTIEFYNKNTPENNDSTKINWVRSTVQDFNRGIKYNSKDINFLKSYYRPFCKQNLGYYSPLIDMTYQFPKIFPNGNDENFLICATLADEGKFSVLITDKITDLHFNGDTQCFPLYWYETADKGGNIQLSDFETYKRRDGITDFILEASRRRYGDSVTKEDIFYYVYGFLHLPAYREKFAAELKKSLPRLILVDSAETFWQLRRAGYELAQIHLNYETQEKPAEVAVTGLENCKTAADYRVKKMRLNKETGELIYNEKITIKNIPLRAFEYVVNGRSPIEWIVERYQVKTDKASGIVNDPNDWCTEHNQPRYILDLILSCITVSLKTLDIVENLPAVDFE